MNFTEIALEASHREMIRPSYINKWLLKNGVTSENQNDYMLTEYNEPWKIELRKGDELISTLTEKKHEPEQGFGYTFIETP